MENKKCGITAKIKELQEKYLPYEEKTVKRLVLASAIMFGWLLIWALVLKLGREDLLLRNATNLSQLTLEERLLWDLIPFNYRGSDYEIELQKLTTLLNCFVFAPFGVMFSYLLSKKWILLGAPINLGVVFTIEVLQLATMFGNFATEDFITNMAGYFIGLAIYLLIFRRLNAKQNVIFFSGAVVILAVMTVISLVSTGMAMDTMIDILTRLR